MFFPLQIIPNKKKENNKLSQSERAVVADKPFWFRNRFVWRTRARNVAQLDEKFRFEFLRYNQSQSQKKEIVKKERMSDKPNEPRRFYNDRLIKWAEMQ